MKSTLSSLLALAMVALPAGVYASDAGKTKTPSPVEVIFDNPEAFTDFKETSSNFEKDRENLEHIFRTHLEKAAKPYLAEGQKLELRFIDIDLAGDFEPWRGVNFHDIRILKDVYPPRMKFEFRLVGADGKVLAEGKRELSDMAYLMTISIRRDDPNRYDKELLDRWLRSEFKKAS